MKYNQRMPSNITVERIFRQILLRELKLIKKWRKVAIKGQDPEGIHQIRISLRRIRTVLIVFKPIINTKFSQTLAKKLKQYAAALDDARDLDVYMLTHFNNESDSTIKSSAMTQRSKAYQRVKKLLQSKPFKKKLRAYKKWVKTGHWQQKIIIHKKLNNSLQAFAFNSLDALIKIIIIKGQQSVQLDDLALHKLRIDCKKLRYATEIFIPFYDNNLTLTFIENLKKLQDSLGDNHDAFIQRQLHQRLLQKDEKIHLTLASQQVLLQIDHTAKVKKSQVTKQLATFCNTEYFWRV